MILVTGGTGLIGAHLLVQLCDRHQNVRAIYRSLTGIDRTKSLFALYGKTEEFNKIEWVEADITDIPALDQAFVGISHVYHAAALISFDPSDEEKLRKTNIEGTANVVNCALHHNVRKICHVSSTSALGDLKPGETELSEESEWNPERPHSDYGISKHGSEMEVWRGQQEGLEAVVVNPGIVIGPGFWESGSGKMFSIVHRGPAFYTRGTTGFVDVRDVVSLMCKAMESNVNGERFICIAENLTYEDAMSRIAEVLNVKMPSIYAKPWMTSIAWRVDWFLGKFGKKRLLTKEDAHSLHNTDRIRNDKVMKRFGFTYRNLSDSIRETGEQFLKDHSTRGASGS